MSHVRVALVGYGTIGKRLAAGLRAQPDLRLAGVGIRSPSPAALAASLTGIPLFCADPDREGALRDAGLPLAGGLDDLLAGADVVADCSSTGTAAAHLPRYRRHGLPAAFCGGERHEAIGLTVSSFCNYADALGAGAARVTSCNTTALVRVLAVLDDALGVSSVHAVLVRSAADLDKAGKGVVAGATVVPGRSHHADDLALLLPGLAAHTQAIAVPTVHGHVAFLAVTPLEPAPADEVAALLAAAPRVLLEDGAVTTSALRERGDRHEALVWRDSVVVEEDALYLALAIHMESVVVPETIDCLRALAGGEPDAAAAMRRTDEALRIAKEPAAYERFRARVG